MNRNCTYSQNLGIHYKTSYGKETCVTTKVKKGEFRSVECSEEPWNGG